MRIVVATFTFRPALDGVSIAAARMVDDFVDDGHEVHVVTSGNAFPSEDGSAGYQIHRFNRSDSGSSSCRYLDFLRQIHADILIFHCWGTWFTESVVPHLGKIPGKKILFSHGYDSHVFHRQPAFPWGIPSWLRRMPRVLRLPVTLRQFDHIVFLSASSDWHRFFDVKIASLVARNNYSIIPNTVSAPVPQSRPDFRRSHDIPESLFFLCVANYSPRKNQRMALDAFVNANIKGSTLVFIGSSLGEYGGELVSRWENLRPNYPNLRVLILENVPRDTVLSAIASCDIVLLSATAETQPIILLEAMVHSKPFISTDTGCVHELAGGIICADITTMTETMIQLSNSGSKRQELGESGKAHFDCNHSRAHVRSSWSKLLNQVVSS